MKRLLCIFLALIITASAVACFGVSAAGADTLTVKDGGKTLATVKVGNEFIYRVGVNSGDRMIYSGQGYVKYDSAYVQVVEYGTADSSGEIDMDSYCFPESIRKTSLVTNYTGIKDYIRYNYTKPKTGVGVFDSVSLPYFKIRFKATAPGVVEISHVFEIFTTRIDEKTVRIFTDGVPNEKLSPAPYQQTAAEPAVALVGDADGDFDVTVMDATFIQRVTAGVKASYNSMNADVNGDGDVNLKDALAVRRYKAGMSAARVGEWIFDSELGEIADTGYAAVEDIAAGPAEDIEAGGTAEDIE